MYKLDLTLHALPKSNNKSLRSHWAAQRREGKMFDLLIAGICRGKLPAQPLKKAHITITRHFWRTLDFDGLVGSLKPVVDALVSAGVIEDDNWNVLGSWEVDQQFRTKKEGPLLTIQVREVVESEFEKA